MLIPITSRAKIESVWLDDADCDKNGMGSVLNISLDNGTYIALSLDSKINSPRFHEILMGRYKDRAKTDGSRVYWSNGACLTFRDMIMILRTKKDARGGI